MDNREKVTIFKATVAEAGATEQPASLQDDTSNTLRDLVASDNLLMPPYDPLKLMRIVENSSALNQNIESYSTNIDGLGYRLEPVFDFESDEVHEKVREAMWLKTGELENMPSDDEVEEEMKSLRTRARFEELMLRNFLEYINPEGSFTSLRRQTRQHLETIGNAYWEILRNKEGKVSRALLVPATHVRLTKQDKDPIAVEDEVPSGPLQTETIVQYRFFRRYVQVISRTAVYFKEFGDPRVVSRKTGNVYKDMDEFEANKAENDKPATEMLHFKLPRPGEAYGMPRWVGVLLAALGSRAADEVNFDYFENKTIPPLAILVQGGRLGKDDHSKIETYIRDQIKGRRNFHKILILEANVSDAQQLSGVAAAPKIEFKPLTETQLNDGQFQTYDERNIDKIGSAFRLPRLMRGDVRDFNKSTAMASLRFAEEQVFEPERKEFDAFINRKILPELGIMLWKFKSAGNRTRDPDIVSEVMERLVKVNVLTINEARAILADALGMTIPALPYDWAKQPLELTLAGHQLANPTDERDENSDLDIMADEARTLAEDQDRAVKALRQVAVRTMRAAVEEEHQQSNED